MIWRVNEMPQFKWGFSIPSEVRKLWYNANIWCNNWNRKFLSLQVSEYLTGYWYRIPNNWG